MSNLYYLTDDQRAIRNLAREIARERIAPLAAHVDETGEYPHEQLKLLGQQGLMGLHIPEAYGGGAAGPPPLCPAPQGGGWAWGPPPPPFPGPNPRGYPAHFRGAWG